MALLVLNKLWEAVGEVFKGKNMIIHVNHDKHENAVMIKR
jgi:hypothetical protein